MQLNMKNNKKKQKKYQIHIVRKNLKQLIIKKLQNMIINKKKQMKLQYTIEKEKKMHV